MHIVFLGSLLVGRAVSAESRKGAEALMNQTPPIRTDRAKLTSAGPIEIRRPTNAVPSFSMVLVATNLNPEAIQLGEAILRDCSARVIGVHRLSSAGAVTQEFTLFGNFESRQALRNEIQESFSRACRHGFLQGLTLLPAEKIPFGEPTIEIPDASVDSVRIVLNRRPPRNARFSAQAKSKEAAAPVPVDKPADANGAPMETAPVSSTPAAAATAPPAPASSTSDVGPSSSNPNNNPALPVNRSDFGTLISGVLSLVVVAGLFRFWKVRGRRSSRRQSESVDGAQTSDWNSTAPCRHATSPSRYSHVRGPGLTTKQASLTRYNTPF